MGSGRLEPRIPLRVRIRAARRELIDREPCLHERHPVEAFVHEHDERLPLLAVLLPVDDEALEWSRVPIVLALDEDVTRGLVGRPDVSLRPVHAHKEMLEHAFD